MSGKLIPPLFAVSWLTWCDGSFLIGEHLGMLWEDEYLRRQAEKIQMYLREGYVLGVSFFVTSDDASGGTSSDAIWQLAELVQERF